MRKRAIALDGEGMLARRKFVQHMALIAAGAAALPVQVEAYERLYDVNTERFGEAPDIIQIDEITFGFAGPPIDRTYRISFMDDSAVHLSLTLNHRATFRWVGMPQSPILTRLGAFRWHVEPFAAHSSESAADDVLMEGSVRFTDMTARMHTVMFSGRSRQLVVSHG